MGEQFIGSNQQSNGQAIQPSRTTTGNHSPSTSTTSTTGGRTGTSGTGTSGNETAKEKFPALVTVEQTDEQKRLERNEKRRQRYKEQKEQSGQAVKPRKVNKTKKENVNETFTQEQMSTLLLSISSVIASRPNCEHWMLTQKEVDSITKPLLNILKESEKVTMITEHSNQIALSIACITIFVPRLILTVQKMNEEKEKKEIAKEVKKIDEIRPTKTSNQESVRPNHQSSTSHNADNSKFLQEIGLPIS